MMRDLDARLGEAVRHFWRMRQSQSTRQGESEDRDRGGRGAVTGGKQMDGFVRLVRELLIAANVPQSCIAVDKLVELPGWFRAEKKWDLVIVHEKELLAALEFKSQIGPSFGNNFNNRTEEALAAPRTFGRRIAKARSGHRRGRFWATLCCLRTAIARDRPSKWSSRISRSFPNSAAPPIATVTPFSLRNCFANGCTMARAFCSQAPLRQKLASTRSRTRNSRSPSS